MSYGSDFQDDWLSHPDYKNWVGKDANRKKAFCSLCHKSLELSNMGTQALKSHVNGKKHKKLAQPLACFFKPPAKKKDKSQLIKYGFTISGTRF